MLRDMKRRYRRSTSIHVNTLHTDNGRTCCSGFCRTRDPPDVSTTRPSGRRVGAVYLDFFADGHEELEAARPTSVPDTA
eukprot:1223412-Rhodomonas_salina.1